MYHPVLTFIILEAAILLFYTGWIFNKMFQIFQGKIMMQSLSSTTALSLQLYLKYCDTGFFGGNL